MVYVDLLLWGFIQDLEQYEYLVGGGIARSKAALIMSNQAVDNWLSHNTLDKTLYEVLGCRSTIFVDWAKDT